ncbi:MAG: aldo/keto reductase, partial [Fimbriimonadaceae bacterium]|nr:aldo/keto reductase [Fimbriimonadaceae bacterium]
KDELNDWPNTARYSAYYIRRACEASLKRMQTDVIDLYQFHHIARECPWDEVWEAMSVLIQQGKITYVGSSNFAGWNIAQACETAKAKGTLGLISEQSKYSLIQREIELEVAPACNAYGLGIIPWSPLGGGVLGGVMKKQDGARRYGDWTKWILENKGKELQAWEDLCDEIGHAPGEVALAWTLVNPAVAAPIIGPRTMEQLESAVRALEIKLSEDVLKKIDEIFPPFKTAPEHYAW